MAESSVSKLGQNSTGRIVTNALRTTVVGARLDPILRAGLAEAASGTYDALAINDNQATPAVSAAVELVRQIEAKDVA